SSSLPWAARHQARLTTASPNCKGRPAPRVHRTRRREVRTRTLLVALLALFPLTASASPYDRPHGGFFLRLHQATLVSDDIPDRFIEPYTGFGLGVYAGIPLGEVLGLQTEIGRAHV